MVSILDLKPVGEKQIIQGHEVIVRGVSVDALTALMGEVPEVRLLFAGKKMEGDLATKLITLAPHVAAMLIVAGLGENYMDEEQVAAARQMAPGDMASILATIVRLTFPQGIVAFMESLTNVAAMSGGPIKEAVTSSPEQSNGASATGTTE